MDQRLTNRSQNHKNPRRKQAAKSQILLIEIFYQISLPRQGKQKKKKQQMELHLTKKFSHSKGKHQ